MSVTAGAMNINCYEFTVLKSSQAHLIAFCDNWLSRKRKYDKRNQSLFSVRSLKWWLMESYCFSGEGGECSAVARKLLKQMSVVLKVEASVSKGSSQLNFLMCFNSHALAQARTSLLRACAKIEETVPVQRIIKIINRWRRKTQFFFSVRRELADHSMTIRCKYNPTVTKTHLFLVCIRWFFQQRWGITRNLLSLFTWARTLGENILHVYK